MPARELARLLILAGLWGGSFAFIRIAVPALGPLWLAFLRVALAFGALFVLALAKRNVPTLRDRWRDHLVVGAVNSAFPFALYCFAEQYVTASTAAVVNATSPFFGAIVAALWLKEALSGRQIAGMLLGLAGVALLVGWEPEPLSAMTLVAMVACLAAALCYGIASVYAKARMAGVPSTSIALYSQLAAAIVLAPTVALAPLPAPPSLFVTVNVLALALASTAFAYLLYFRLIANIGPARALTVTFLIPLFGLLWGVALLGEPLAANTLSACGLILVGTWLATRQPVPRRDESAMRRLQTSSAAGPSTCARNSR